MITAVARKVVVAILTWEARAVVRKYQPRIIAITGSVGKTGTKDAIFTALTASHFVRKSNKSFNSEIGVPLTILGCETGWHNPLKWLANIWEGLALLLFVNHYPKWLVLEVGVDAPGDMQTITEWLKPDVAVITALPDVPVHVEQFASPEDVAREKLHLAHALKPDGVLVICGDDKRLEAFAQREKGQRIVRYGIEAHNDVAASYIRINYTDHRPVGMQCRVTVPEHEELFLLRVRDHIGQQQLYAPLAGLAVAHALEVHSYEKVITALEADAGSRGRMRLIDGHNGSTIIDDSYNSSPAALRAALTALKKITVTGRKIAVLGDMLELGKYSAEEHKKAGVYVAGIADTLVTVGVRAKAMAAAAREAGFDPECIFEFDTGEATQAGREVRAMLEDGDIVLVKGSQSGIRLERAVKEMMATPSNAPELLVRQEAAWLAQ